MLSFTPLPFTKLFLTPAPGPFGACMPTSILRGGIILVYCGQVSAKPCENSSILPSVKNGLRSGHDLTWSASENKFTIIVARLATSSSDGNKFSSGQQ